MANIPEAIASAGASSLRFLSKLSPTLGGKAGRFVDWSGRLVGNPLPELGATEFAESRGGVQIASKDPGKAAAKEIERANQLGIPLSSQTQQKITTQRQIATGGINPNETATGRSDLLNVRSMGYNVGDVVDFGGAKWRWTGATWEPSGGGGGGGGGSPPLGEAGVRDIAARIPGMTKEDLARMDISKWAKETTDRTADIARQMEEEATAVAERDYSTVKEALGVQKGEVQTLAAQQKEQLRKEKEFTEAGLTGKETTETEKIEKEKEAFRKETEQSKEELATNWRDLSLEMQRAMRARGVSDSAFAASNDAKLMLDFNKGLRQVAVKSEAAYKDFADAVIETNKYYTRERERLRMDYDKSNTDIDSWVRQNIQSIQAQENVALNRKLADIKNAILQANQLKAQVAQKISDQELGLSIWMAKFQMQLKASVAKAATGKVNDAWKNIAAVRQNTNIIKTVLENGGEFIKKATADGSQQWFVHGPAIRADGTFDFVDLPVTEGYVQTTGQISGDVDIYSSLYGRKPSYKDAYSLVFPKRLPSIPSSIFSK